MILKNLGNLKGGALGMKHVLAHIRPRTIRFFIILFMVTMLGIGVFLMKDGLKEHLVFFYTPSDLKARKIPLGQKISIGGWVRKKSLVFLDEGVRFILEDEDKTPQEILYKGALPDLFREGQGIVAQGIWLGQKTFLASSLLTKHDENYRPPERREQEKV